MGRKLIAAALFSLMAGICSIGCGELDELADCQDICDDYQDCADSKYDVSKCRSDCESRSDKDEDFKSEVNTCSACTDGKSCSEKLKCSGDCPFLFLVSE